MIAWLEPEDIEEEEYRRLWNQACDQRSKLRKRLAKEERGHRLQKDRAARYEERVKAQSREMEEMRVELRLHRHIRRLEAENERLRRRRPRRDEKGDGHG